MTRDQKLADIRKWAIEANPGKLSRHCGVTPCQECKRRENTLTIGLADVLLAINRKETGRMFILDDEGLRYARTPKVPAWNLHKDDINDQSEETLDFIHSLLNV